MNLAIFKGRLTSDPVIRETASGNKATSITIAVNRDYKTKDGEYLTDFVDCVAFDKLGENLGKYFRKGQEIIVEGAMESRHWQDKAGNKRISWQLRIKCWHFCGASSGKGEKSEDQKPQDSQAPSPFKDLEDPEFADGDLPF